MHWFRSWNKFFIMLFTCIIVPNIIDEDNQPREITTFMFFFSTHLWRNNLMWKFHRGNMMINIKGMWNWINCGSKMRRGRKIFFQPSYQLTTRNVHVEGPSKIQLLSFYASSSSMCDSIDIHFNPRIYEHIPKIIS